MRFFLLVRWFKWVFGRIMFLWRCWWFFVERFFQRDLFWLIFLGSRMFMRFSYFLLFLVGLICLDFDSLFIDLGSFVWEPDFRMSFFRLVCFFIVIIYRVSICFHTSTNFSFAHIPKLDFRVLLILILSIIRHIIILGVICMIELAKNIQLINSRRRVINNIIGAWVYSSYLGVLNALRTLDGGFSVFAFAHLMLVLALGWCGTF